MDCIVHRVAKSQTRLSDLLFHFSFRIDWFDLALQGTLKSSPTQQFESISSSVLSLLYGPTLTSEGDYWKNRSFY